MEKIFKKHYRESFLRELKGYYLEVGEAFEDLFFYEPEDDFITSLLLMYLFSFTKTLDEISV